MTAKKSAKPAAKQAKKDDKLLKHINELTDDLKRIQADFVNYKRRTEAERERAVRIGKELAVQALLPVADSIDRALATIPADLADTDYIKGVHSVSKQLFTAFKQLGVSKIETVGAEFDAELMEAVAMEDGDGHKEIVAEELQAGYTMGDTVIRHAMVKVKKA